MCCSDYLESRVNDLERRIDAILRLVVPAAVGRRVTTGRRRRYIGGHPLWEHNYSTRWSGVVTRADTEVVWFESDGKEYETGWESVTFEESE